MFDIGISHLLGLSGIIFSIGVIGVFCNMHNLITMIMSIELLLLAVCINFVSFSVYHNDISGQVFTIFILTVAAAETAVGLAVLIMYFRSRDSISAEEAVEMRG